MKLYVAAGVFLALTAAKMLLPEQLGAARAAMLEQIDRSVDYKAAAAMMTQRLGEYSARLDEILSVSGSATRDPDLELPFAHTAPLGVMAVSAGFGGERAGLELTAAEGESVCAFAGGAVVTAAYDEGYGNYIVLRHDADYETLYARCGRLLVSAGESVSAGQRIALAGPELYFELRENGVGVDPAPYL